MKHIWTTLIISALMTITTSAARAEKATPDRQLQEIVDQIHAAYEKIDDLKSKFVQTVEIMDFNTPYVSNGNLFIKKGKMRWDYIEPSKQQIFVDGGGFLFYVPDHKQVIRSKVGGHSDSHLPLNLLSGRGHIDQDFDISYEIEAPMPGEPIHLRLVPKKKMGVLKIIITAVRALGIDGLIIDKIVLHEENGNISTSSFEEISINQGLDDALFIFDIPEGVEILDAP
ncbi:outer membrane lipoprotein carrier protein LolA [Nitrospira defluvii]|nr:outer membrane lipoprotein carrier protein LolA [Nitrospira defluvii]